MSGYWFFDLVIILCLVYLIFVFSPGLLDRIKRRRMRIQAKTKVAEAKVRDTIRGYDKKTRDLIRTDPQFQPLRKLMQEEWGDE